MASDPRNIDVSAQVKERQVSINEITFYRWLKDCVQLRVEHVNPARFLDPARAKDCSLVTFQFVLLNQYL